MTHPPKRWRYPLAVLTVLLAGVAACTGHPAPASSPKEGPLLPITHQADAVNLLKSHADTLATTIGGQLTGWRTIPAPCEGRNGEQATDGRWNLSGHANIPVPPDRHVETLQRIHDQWQQQGYEITEFRTFPDGKTGTLTGHNPADGVSITMESTVPGTEFALIMVTPCYRPAPGETPGS